MAKGPDISSSPRYEEWRKEDFAKYYKHLGEHSPKYRVRAVDTIAKEYRDFIEARILPLLKSKKTLERRSAIEILYKAPHKRFIPALLEYVRNEELEDLKVHAIRTLGFFDGEELNQTLLKLYDKATNAEKSLLLDVLGQKQYEEAVETMKQALKHENERVRNAAVMALTKFKRAEFVDIFISMYEDPSSKVRYSVLKSFQLFNIKNSPRIITVLERAKSDQDHRVKRLAKKMLTFDRIH